MITNTTTAPPIPKTSIMSTGGGVEVGLGVGVVEVVVVGSSVVVVGSVVVVVAGGVHVIVYDCRTAVLAFLSVASIRIPKDPLVTSEMTPE